VIDQKRVQFSHYFQLLERNEVKTNKPRKYTIRLKENKKKKTSKAEKEKLEQELKKIDEKYQLVLQKADEKVAIAIQTYDAVDKCVKYLNEKMGLFETQLRAEIMEENTRKQQLDLMESSRKKRSRPSSRQSSMNKCQPVSSYMAPQGFIEEVAIDPNEPRYCICNRVSSGNMVGCDNDYCEGGEWFHFECVGLTEQPKGKWYCPQCRETMGKPRKRKRNA
jgi:inhibitor of growth protein 4